MASATMFKGFVTPLENRSLIVITKDIQEGKYKQPVEAIRALIREGKFEEAENQKKQLLGFTPSATFNGGRKPEYVVDYSQYIVLDLDNLQPQQLEDAFQKASEIKYTFCCFRSPSGNGLKILVEVNSDKEQHEQAYNAVADFYEKELNVIIDRSGKDITRLCFVSYDPHLYKNIYHEKYPILEIIQVAPLKTPTENSLIINNTNSDEHVFLFQQQVLFTNKKAEYSNGNRNNYIFRLASNCNRVGILQTDALALISQEFDLPQKEIANAVNSAYKNHKHEFATITPSIMTEEESMPEQMPTLPDEIFSLLPDFLQRIVSVATSKEERDILLLGSIVALSSCLPKLTGLYDNKQVNANLYLFITAQASAGKGRLIHCRQLVAPIHKAIRTQANILKKEYDAQMQDYNSKKKNDTNLEKPVKPPEKMLFIPANNSSTGFFQLLNDSDSKGFIFETEGDTMAQAFKSDYGNYSHGFRNAFQHEPISYYRRTEREYVEIERPCLSALLSGTPKQIGTLIPNAENGLFSRFMFYVMNIQDVWKNVFECNTDNGLDAYFQNLASEFFTLYQALNNQPEITFSLTAEQQLKFNKYFTEAQTLYISLKGLDYIGTVRRSGLIAFRMMMVISVLRILETGDLSNQIICTDNDFDNTLKIIKVLISHAAKVYSDLPEEPAKPKPKNRKELFLEALPYSFNRQDYVAIAANLKIADKTAQAYITQLATVGIIKRDEHNNYLNPAKAPK